MDVLSPGDTFMRYMKVSFLVPSNYEMIKWSYALTIYEYHLIIISHERFEGLDYNVIR